MIYLYVNNFIVLTFLKIFSVRFLNFYFLIYEFFVKAK